MKRLILAGMLVMLAVTVAHAGASVCRVYDYQEMKEMTDNELQAALDFTHRSGEIEMESASNLVKLGALRQYDRAMESYRICDEQNGRLQSVRDKRPSFAPSPKPTYEQCVKKLTEIGADTDPCKMYLK